MLHRLQYADNCTDESSALHIIIPQAAGPSHVSISVLAVAISFGLWFIKVICNIITGSHYFTELQVRHGTAW